MLNAQQTTESVRRELAASADELMRSTSRLLFMAFIGVYIACLVATAAWPMEISEGAWIIGPLGILACYLSLRVLKKDLVMAQAIWQLSLLVLVTLAVSIFRQPELAFLYALLPFIATLVFGLVPGVIVEGLVVLIVTWFLWLLVPLPIDRLIVVVTLLASVVGVMLGWASTRTLLTVTEWSLRSWEIADKNLEEVRQHRAQLAQLVSELDHAYYRLKRANDMLIIARSQAEEAQEARNRFTLSISHELRTPLNFIIGFSQIMVNAPATYAPAEQWPAGLYEDIQEIYRSSNHLLRLVNDVLDLGQIEKMQMALYKQWTAPEQIMSEVLDMVRPAFSRKGLGLAAQAGPGLPKVFADHARMRQVLLNLVSNAMRFTEHGGVTISAENNQAGEILFCVADTGVGISQETMSKIFEPFQRVIVDDWRQREGFGLGVPISKRFVELHGGRMWVESELSVGTRFYFTLPVSAAANQPRALLDGDLEQRDAHYWQQLQDKARSESLIMVLSPDPTAGDVIAPYVEDYGVVCVQNPAEVVPKVEEVLPSALFVDQRIAAEPAVVALVAGLAYDLPVVTFSFPGHPAHPQHLPEYVANYLVKPVDTDTLTSAVSAMGPGVRDLLIVDDDPAMLRFVQRALAAPGDGESRLAGSDGEGRPGTAAPYRLVTASTGERAIAAIRQDHPDLVLLDLALPDISGWEVLKEAQKGKTPVIIVTAQDWRLTPVAGGQDTLRLTLPRPLKHQELQGVLNGLLGSIHPSYAERLGAPARPAIAPGQTVS